MRTRCCLRLWTWLSLLLRSLLWPGLLLRPRLWLWLSLLRLCLPHLRLWLLRLTGLWLRLCLPSLWLWLRLPSLSLRLCLPHLRLWLWLCLPGL